MQIDRNIHFWSIWDPHYRDWCRVGEERVTPEPSLPGEAQGQWTKQPCWKIYIYIYVARLWWVPWYAYAQTIAFSRTGLSRGNRSIGECPSASLCNKNRIRWLASEDNNDTLTCITCLRLGGREPALCHQIESYSRDERLRAAGPQMVCMYVYEMWLGDLLLPRSFFGARWLLPERSGCISRRAASSIRFSATDVIRLSLTSSLESHSWPMAMTSFYLHSFFLICCCWSNMYVSHAYNFLDYINPINYVGSAMDYFAMQFLQIHLVDCNPVL